ncbi:MAG: ABC transporter permease, partial [Muribaculaceae bacterium]|nr:ABC transporter permease [Muribaculaceae bacterium]
MWIAIELIIVSLVIWWLTLTLLRNYKDSQIPLGADMNDVYAAQISFVESNVLESNNVEMSPDEIETYINAMQGMLDRIKRLPMVEAAALGYNAMPYNYMRIARIFSLLQDNDTIKISANIRRMTPDGARVLRLQSLTGLNPDDMKKILEKGEVLVGPSLQFEESDSVRDLFLNHLIGKDILDYSMRVGGVIQCVRRTDYETNIEEGSVIMPIMEGSISILELDNLLVRVKPGMGRDFIKAMQAEPTLVSPAIISINNLRSMEDDKKLILWKDQVAGRTYVAGIVFLLIIIFIGLLGTFWYRVFLRTPEIAVRKTFGATNMDIFRRFISEAFLIFSIALILSLSICLISIDYLTDSLLLYVSYFKTWKWD